MKTFLWMLAAALCLSGCEKRPSQTPPAKPTESKKDEPRKDEPKKTEPEAPKVNMSHSGEVHFLAFSLEGNVLVSSGADARARVWDAKTGAKKGEVRIEASFQGSSYAIPNADGSRVMIHGMSEWKLVEVTGGKEVFAYAGFRGDVSRDAKWTLRLNKNKADLLSDEGKSVRAFPGPDLEEYVDGAWSADGSKVAAIGYAGTSSTLVVWNAEDGRQISAVKVWGAYGTIGFSPDGSAVLYCTSSDFNSYDLASGKETKLREGALGFKLSPDGKWIVLSTMMAGKLLFEYPAFKEIRALAVESDKSTAYAFSPDSSLIAVGTESGKIRYLSVADGSDVTPK